MAPGKVDLSRLVARKGDLNPNNPTVESVHRVALRKNWARPGKASYWVDVLWCSLREQYQVYRSWRWPQNGKMVEGYCWSGRPGDRERAIDNLYPLLKTLVDEKAYVVDQVFQGPKSPLPLDSEATQGAVPQPTATGLPAAAGKPAVSPPLATAASLVETPPSAPKPKPKPKKKPVLARKGDFDWW